MTAHVEVHGVSKRFGGTVALDSVQVTIEQGTVHALIGENGAGKSTLGKIIAGVVAADEGTVAVLGEQIAFKSPRQALAAGITMVAQELSLVPDLTVVENVFLGIESVRGPMLRKQSDLVRFESLVERHGVSVAPDAKVSALSVAERQKVEILRALARDAELIVMDEPTARLTSSEAHSLRETVRALAAGGVTVLYISHFLQEVLAIADVITIMRDGAIIRTSPAGNEDHESLIEGMVGRSLDATFPERRRPASDAQPVLEVRSLTRTGVFENVSFDVRAGEIVTLAGLVGAGRSEVVRAIFGADRITHGTMALGGEPHAPKHPRDAIRAGMAMVPESRKTEGLLPLLTVKNNLTLAHLSDFVARGGMIRRGEERTMAETTAQNVGLTGATVDAKMLQLSGGNQQKSLFGRWMVGSPRLFIADEPTRGVDVGAKRGIYNLLVDLAASGMAVLLVSSELEEVLGLSHRILVMRGGRIVADLEAADSSEEEIMGFAFGGAVV